MQIMLSLSFGYAVPPQTGCYAGSLFLQTLRTLRQRWVTKIACGPGLYVDLQVAQDGLEAPSIELDIGPPIRDLSEGLEQDQDELDRGSLALHRDGPAGNGAGGAREAVGGPEAIKIVPGTDPSAAENGCVPGNTETNHDATAVYHAPAEESHTTGS